jgi:hypothetical protein
VNTDLGGQAEQCAVAAPDLDQIVVRPKTHLIDNSPINRNRDFLFSRAAQCKVMEIFQVCGVFTAIFYVVIGTRDHNPGGNYKSPLICVANGLQQQDCAMALHGSPGENHLSGVFQKASVGSEDQSTVMTTGNLSQFKAGDTFPAWPLCRRMAILRSAV